MLGKHALGQLPTCHEGSMHGKRVTYQQVRLAPGNSLQPQEVMLYWLAWSNTGLPIWSTDNGKLLQCSEHRYQVLVWFFGCQLLARLTSRTAHPKK